MEEGHGIDIEFMRRWHERTVKEAEEYRRNAFAMTQEEFDAMYDDDYFEMLELFKQVWIKEVKMNCCKVEPKKKVKKRKRDKCGGADNRAAHLNLLQVQGQVVDGVQVYRFQRIVKPYLD